MLYILSGASPLNVVLHHMAVIWKEITKSATLQNCTLSLPIMEYVANLTVSRNSNNFQNFNNLHIIGIIGKLTLPITYILVIIVL
jgi:hypothetical protein